MFSQRTVFILGAGASWHYGYPTGYELIEKILEKADFLLQFKTHQGGDSWNPPTYSSNIPLCFLKDYKEGTQKNFIYKETWNELQKQCNELILRIKSSDPLSIDFFLTKNPSVTKITKILIGWVLLECQNRYETSDYNPNRRPIEPGITPLKKEDNWVKFIISKLISTPNICNNQIDFITFNYDLSLENKIKQALLNTETIKDEDVSTFFKDRIHHVYGEIKLPKDFKDLIINFKKDKNRYLGQIIDMYYKASEDLEIIAPKGETDLSEIKKKISNAKTVYILGYGFDDMNNSNLALSQALNYRVCNDVSRKVYFTNMGDKNVLNKKVGALFLEDITKYMPNESFIQIDRDNGYYYEKSIKSVYDALSEDFDL